MVATAKRAVLACAALGVASMGAWVAPTAQGREVTLAVPVSLQPYFIPQRGAGLSYEVIQASFAARGHSVAPIYISERTVNAVLSKDSRVDCVGIVNAELKGTWHMVEQSNSFHDVAVTLTERGLDISRISDLVDKNAIAFYHARDVLGPEFRETVAKNPRYREINNHRAQIKLLLKKRVDVIIADRRLVEWYLKYLEGETGVHVPVTFHDLFRPAGRALACRDKALAEEFASGVKAIEANGVLGEILERYP